MRQPGAYSGRIAGKTGPHSLPLARIKKIMKRSGSGEDVKMISGEAPIVFAKACELFIEELSLRSWMFTLQGKRRTLHKQDVASAVMATDNFDFLAELVSESKSTPCPANAAAAASSKAAAVEQQQLESYRY